MDDAVYIFKARLVAKGFTQTYGVDYEETFSPVADIRAIRILIAIAAYYDYEIWQMDVKTAFLNGHLSEEVYMEQPEGNMEQELRVSCYTDAGYLTDADNLKSQTGYMQNISCFFGMSSNEAWSGAASLLRRQGPASQEQLVPSGGKDQPVKNS
ncbi:retrotransposon protein, putative, ty1-copia subclass [Tanacetum coccineum]|uniref:Retrotransposon protein, putative, ty1-copia subclass n=1 Tax=Tanacetum coccineum TaxID=301880 RepID=A0ABQ5ITG5_9ASTR